MSAFEDALALDAEREIFDGEFSQVAVRTKRDGSTVEVSVTCEPLDERIEQMANEEGVVSVIRVVAPIDQKPELEEAWEIDGLRYAVKRFVESNAVWTTFDAERWSRLRTHRQGSYSE